MIHFGGLTLIMVAFTAITGGAAYMLAKKLYNTIGDLVDGN